MRGRRERGGEERAAEGESAVAQLRPLHEAFLWSTRAFLWHLERPDRQPVQRRIRVLQCLHPVQLRHLAQERRCLRTREAAGGVAERQCLWTREAAGSIAERQCLTRSSGLHPTWSGRAVISSSNRPYNTPQKRLRQPERSGFVLTDPGRTMADVWTTTIAPTIAPTRTQGGNPDC